MDEFPRWEFSGGIQGGHRGSEGRQIVQAGHHRALRQRPDRQEARRRPRRPVRRPARLQAPDHRRERQGRLPDAVRPAGAAAEGPPGQRGRRVPSSAPGDPEEEDGPREHGVAGHPPAEPEDRPARAEVDRRRVAGAGAMKVPGQPEVNIGVVGHVDHGKSTLTERLTGERTDRHSEEIKRGISIRLGYADMAIYKCPKQAEENYKQILAFVKGTVAEGAPIVPVSAHHDVNLDVLLMMIQKVIPTKPHDETKPARMYVARSFDVNQPGISPDKIVGGVMGGSLIQGRTKVGEEIEISPGRQVTVGNRTEWKNLTTSIRSLHSGGAARKDVRPGGLIAIGTNLDPVLTKADGLVGRVVGPPGSLPEVVMKMSVEVNLLERVVGVPEELKVEGIKTSEPLMVSVGTATTVGVLTSARENRADMALKIHVVAELGQRVAVSRRIGGKWRLIGYGVIK